MKAIGLDCENFNRGGMLDIFGTVGTDELTRSILSNWLTGGAAICGVDNLGEVSADRSIDITGSTTKFAGDLSLDFPGVALGFMGTTIFDLSPADDFAFEEIDVGKFDRVRATGLGGDVGTGSVMESRSSIDCWVLNFDWILVSGIDRSITSGVLM
jgi:hypothetical protein